MSPRTLLFVPGDRSERFAKALASGADAVIFDLEDSVAVERKAFARDAVAEFLAEPVMGVKRLVRINPVDHPDAALDVAVASGADVLVLPKAEGVDTVTRLDALADRPVPPLLPIATETPWALFRLGDYRTMSERLFGLTWGAEDLPAAIGAQGSREVSGRYRPPFELARSLALFAAHAAETAAIDTVYPDLKNLEGLAAYARRAAADGFSGMLALHPAQIEPIHDAFRPGPEAVEEAHATVAALAGASGAVQLNGRMVDLPHLKAAQQVLSRSDCSALGGGE